MSRKMVLLIALILILAWAVLAAQRSTPSSEYGPAPELTIQSVDGKKTSLSELKGKVVLVDFWGTWCGPCRMSIPTIEQLYQKYKGRGFEVMGVALEHDGGKQIPEFVKQMGMSYRIGMPTSGEQIKAYQPDSVPMMVLVDKDGNVQLRIAGFSSEVEGELSSRIENLL